MQIAFYWAVFGVCIVAIVAETMLHVRWRRRTAAASAKIKAECEEQLCAAMVNVMKRVEVTSTVVTERYGRLPWQKYYRIRLTVCLKAPIDLVRIRSAVTQCAQGFRARPGNEVYPLEIEIKPQRSLRKGEVA